MKKLSIWLSVFLFSGGIAFAAPPGTPAPWTYKSNTVVKPVSTSVEGADIGYLLLTEYTVATLPTLAAGDAGALALISDGDGVSDCTTGSGSDRVVCRWTGSAWTSAGDGTAAGSAEIVDEVFSAANFNADTTHGVSQDDFYDLWHGVDADDDGSFEDEAWLTAYMTPAEFTTAIGAAYDTAAELEALFSAKQDAATAATDTELGALQADDLVTLSGVAIGSTHLGEFTGTTITDNQTIKASLQLLETAVELAGAADAFTLKVDAAATAGYLGAAYNDGILRTDGTILTYTDGGDYVTLGVHANLADLAGITGVQGDVLYYNGTDWVALGYGTDGQYLQTKGVGANPQWASTSVSGDIEYVGDVASGNAFTATGAGNELYFEGATSNGWDTLLTAADPGENYTITLPAATGTVVLTTTMDGENITNDTIDDDSIDWSDVTAADITMTDAGAITASSLITASAGLTVATGQHITVGTTQWDVVGADTIDGEQIAADTIDDDSIDFADVTLADLTFDVGSVSTTEFGYLNNVTSAIQTQLDARALESAFGETVQADDFVITSTVLNLVAEIPHVDATTSWSADQTFTDGTGLIFGTAGEYANIEWDTDVSDNDGDLGASLTGEGLVFTLNGSGADSQVIFNNSDGTYGVDLYVKDIFYSGSVTSTNTTGDSYLSFTNNSSGLAPSGYRMYFETDTVDVLSYSLNGSEKRVANLSDAQTITGAKTFSNDIIMTEVADHQSTVTAGQGMLWVKSDTPAALYYTDDAGTDFNLTAASAGDVQSVGDCAGGACLDGSSDGGTYVNIYDGDSHYAKFDVPNLSGNVTYTFPATTDTIATLEGSTTQVIFNSGGTTYAGDTGFTFAAATNALTLGADTQDGSLILFNETGATDYTATIQPGTQTANAVITLPGSTSTLATLGANTLSGHQTFANTYDLLSGTAGGSDIGGADNEFDNLYLHDGAVIYGQANQTATLTSSASTWTASNLASAGTLGVTGVATFTANPRIYDGNSNHATLDTPDISGDITITLPAVTSTLATLGANTFTGAQDLGANNLTMTGALAATGSRISKGWFTDLESTDATIGDDLSLTSDGAIVTIGATGPVTLTHNAGATGTITMAGATDAAFAETWDASGILAMRDDVYDAIATIDADVDGKVGSFEVTANNSADETVYPVFVDTDITQAETDSSLSYNPSSNTLTVGVISATTVNASTFASTAADGSHYLDVTNGAALAATETEGLLAENGGVFYVSDGTDWAKYLLASEGNWTALGAATFTTINLPTGDASPSTTAGQIRHDTAVTDTVLATGALAWWDGDEVRYVVDLDVLPATDNYVVAYDADDDKFYMKEDATGAGGDQLVDIVATSPLLVNATTNVNDALPGSDADITFSISANPEFTTIELGAAATDTTIARSGAGAVTIEGNQVLLGGVATGGVLLGDATPDAAGEVGYDSGKFSFFGANSEDLYIEPGNAANSAVIGSASSVATLTMTALDLVVGGSDVSLGSAGVKLTGDGDGALTILGLGDGSDEDLTINLDDTANTAVFSSSTGVTSISFGSIGLATTGTILGAINVVVTTDGTESPTAAQMYGSMFIADHATATSNTTYTLPAAAAGMVACFYDNGAGTGGITIDVDASDVILLDGVALDAGDTIDSPGVAGDGANGDFISLMAIDATTWITLGRSGTWVDGGAS